MNNRILYSCCAYGGQHKIQSNVMADLLRAAGYEVMLLDNLPTYIMPCENNSLLLDQCDFEEFPSEARANLAELIDEVNPMVVINDLEPLVPMMLKSMGREIPIISIDSMHSIDYVDIENISGLEVPDKAYRAYKKVVDAASPGAKLRIIPTFFKPDWNVDYGDKAEVKFFGPIIRPAIQEQIPVNLPKTVLVYNTNNSWADLPDFLLKNYPQYHFSFFGFGGPHREDFEKLLARCSFVITNGGHGVISEAIYLDKPLFCLPLENHYEQQLNAWKVAALGLGVCSNKENIQADLDNFITNLPAYRRAVEGYNMTPGNQNILEFLLFHRLLGRMGRKNNK